MQVFIISGGWNGSDYLSSTETWTPESSSAWTLAADLPSARYALAGVSIGGQFLVTGKHEKIAQVL